MENQKRRGESSRANTMQLKSGFSKKHLCFCEWSVGVAQQSCDRRPSPPVLTLLHPAESLLNGLQVLDVLGQGALRVLGLCKGALCRHQGRAGVQPGEQTSLLPTEGKAEGGTRLSAQRPPKHLRYLRGRSRL